MKNIEDLIKSIQAKLKNISKQEKVPYEFILTKFLIERLAHRLLTFKNLKNHLIFKGGYVGLRVYDSPRYTIDLDALIKNIELSSATQFIVKAIELETNDGTWFRNEKIQKLQTQGEYGGIRFVLRTGLGKVPKDFKKAQFIDLDIGIGDPIIPGPILTETPFLLGDGYLSWHVYPVETMVAEKLHALVLRQDDSSRAKDIFDLHFLLPKCNKSNLKKALTETFQHRNLDLPEDMIGLMKNIDLQRLKLSWKKSVKQIVSEVDDFDSIYQDILKILSKILS